MHTSKHKEAEEHYNLGEKKQKNQSIYPIDSSWRNELLHFGGEEFTSVNNCGHYLNL